MPIPAERRDHQAETARRKQPAVQMSDTEIQAGADDLFERAVKLTAGGRPTTYDPDIAALVCARVAAGETVYGISRDEGMPSHMTLFWWEHRHPQFGSALARARQRQGECWGQKAVCEATDEIMTADPHMMKANEMRRRTAADTLLKAAARRDPGNWGEKQHSGGAGVQIVIQTNLQAPDSGAYVARADGQDGQVVDSTKEVDTNLINPDSRSDVSG